MYEQHLTDQQQIELVKKLWKEYGFSIVAGVVIALAVGFGWRTYQQYTSSHAEQASLIYEGMIAGVTQNDKAETKKYAQMLTKDFSLTPYATLAELTLAKLAVQDAQLDEAIQHLNTVIQHARQKDFRQVARIRLARIYLEKNDPSSALKCLAHKDNTAYDTAVAEIQGDAYMALHQYDQARQAYQNALHSLPETSVTKPILEMKLNEVPHTTQ